MTPEQLTTDFGNLFIGIDNKYGQLTGYGKEVKANGKREKLTVIKDGAPPVHDHLSGVNKFSIGTFPFVSNTTVKWGCIDIDEYQITDLHWKLVRQLKELEINNAIVDRSASGGAHIWFFFEKPVNADHLRKKLKNIGEALRYKYEIFPKQPSINLPNNIGNFVYLPYHNGFNKPLQIAYGDDGKYMNLEKFINIAKDKQIKSLKELRVPKATKQNEPETDADETPIEIVDADTDIGELLKEGPVCLEEAYSSNKKESENRNDFLTGFAIFLTKIKGMCPVADIEHINEKCCEPPLEANEIKKIVNSCNKQQYSLKRIHNRKPFEECNKHLCATRKYGVGSHSEYGNWLYVADQGKFIRLKPSKAVVTKQTAADSMWKATGDEKAIKNFMTRVNQNVVDDLQWVPGKDDITEVEGVDGAVKKIFNLYMPPTIKPIEGDPTPFLEFMEKRFGSFPIGLNCFLDVLALRIQKPQQKCNINILVYSKEQGTGKSIIGYLMGDLVGSHNYNNVTMDDFLSGWGDVIMQKIWVDIEEAHSQGTNRKKLLSILNRFSTVRVATLNKKYGAFHQVEILATLYLTTNFDTAMSITDEDRRYLILRTDNDDPELKDQNYEEAKSFQEWLDGDGKGIVLHYLQNRDISKFEPYKPVPRSPHKDEMIKVTYGPGIATCLEAWEYKKWPFTSESSVCAPDVLADIFKCNKDTLIAAMKKFCKIQKLCRVQNVAFEIPPERSNNSNYSRVEGGQRDIHLWSWDNELICQKDILQPSEVLAEYQHPCQMGVLKTFADGVLPSEKKKK